MISICPDCKGDLERVDTLTTREVQGEYGSYDDEFVSYSWICDACLLWWTTLVPR